MASLFKKMNKEEIAKLKEVLKILETGKWEVTMQEQLLNARRLNDFGQVIKKYEEISLKEPKKE